MSDQLPKDEWLHERQALKERIAELEAERDALRVDAVQAVGNWVCGVLPRGFVLELGMESGAAWVVLRPEPYHDPIELPDASDKTLTEQIQDAIDAAIKEQQ